MRRIFWITALVCGWMVSPLSSASAELLVYSATDFVKQCALNTADSTCNDDKPSEVHLGVLLPQDQARYYSSISFPVNGQRVCRFTLVYNDTNAADAITARLIRKAFVNGGNPLHFNIVMASVSSAAGVPNTVRLATTMAINSPVILKGNSFYYVEVLVPTVNLNLLGVQIDVRPTCP
jgi:hypothetical protein